MSVPEIETIEWKCPRCGATPEGHAHLDEDSRYACKGRGFGGNDCMGFICECEGPASDNEAHGTTHGQPCENATCYHCGWVGTFPQRPKKIQAWEKKALDAGWQPPKGWRT